jgi:hypothetical protein
MSTLIEAREAFADALNAVEDLNIRPRGRLRAPRQGDGWITVARLAPSDYTRSAVQLVALVVLGPDDAQAEDLLDTWAVPAIDAVRDLPAADVALEPISLSVDGGAVLNAFTVAITMEVES